MHSPDGEKRGGADAASSLALTSFAIRLRINMAKFIGTVKEFHDYFGPRIHNIVNGITRKHRLAKNGICEFCGSHAELQSAHVHGKDRRTIIESVLKPLTNLNGEVACEIEVVEQQIIAAHMPIEETFKFICHPCHVKYDADESPTKIGEGVRKPGVLVQPDFTKLNRIKLWATRPHQINHKFIRAYLCLEQPNGVFLETFKKECIEKFQIRGFQGHFASLKTDAGNSHGAVFYEDQGRVFMWPTVRKEVESYFK